MKYVSKRNDILEKFMNENSSDVEEMLQLFESFHGHRELVKVDFFKSRKPGQVPTLINENDGYTKAISFNFSDQMENSHTSSRYLLVNLE